MITISENLVLKPITITNHQQLYELMSRIYNVAYSHFWKDSGKWYVDSQYSKENILKELSEENTDYYFVVFEGEIIGNFRIIWNAPLGEMNTKKSVKLHRIYLDSKIQGNGIGKKLLNWLEQEVLKKQYELIWLDTMDEKPQAFEFYKKRGYQYYSHCFLDFELLYDEVRKMSQVFKLLN